MNLIEIINRIINDIEIFKNKLDYYKTELAKNKENINVLISNSNNLEEEMYRLKMLSYCINKGDNLLSLGFFDKNKLDFITDEEGIYSYLKIPELNSLNEESINERINEIKNELNDNSLKYKECSNYNYQLLSNIDEIDLCLIKLNSILNRMMNIKKQFDKFIDAHDRENIDSRILNYETNSVENIIIYLDEIEDRKQKIK